MRALGIILGVALMLTGIPLAAHAQAAATEQAQKLVLVGNKICPVSGEKVDATSGMKPVTYEYNGKVYNLCCPGCVGKFKADPEKYSKIADQEVMKDKEQATDKSMGDMPMGDMPMGHKM
jgi:YHS domain-containing protein